MADSVIWVPRNGSLGMEKYEVPQCLILDRATHYWGSVRCATIEMLPSYDNVAAGDSQALYDPGAEGMGAYLESRENGPLPEIDGITDLQEDDLVLVMCEWNHRHAGVFYIENLGEAGPSGSKWKLIRHDDMDEPEDFPRGLYVKIEEGDRNAGRYYMLYTPPRKGRFGYGPMTTYRGERDEWGDYKVGQTYGFWYRCFEAENLNAGKPSICKGDANVTVEGGLLIKDHETLPDMYYIQTDAHKIKLEHVNLLRGWNQVLAEYNRRAQLARLTGNNTLASYIDYNIPWNRQGQERYGEGSNLIGQRMTFGSKSTTTGGLQFRGTNSLADKLESLRDAEEIGATPIDRIWDQNENHSHVTQGWWNYAPFCHDWIEHFRQILSLGNSYLMHTAYAGQIKRTYKKYGYPANNWTLFDTSIENWSYDWNWGLPLRIDIVQPSFYYPQGLIYRDRIYWYTKIVPEILPDPDDIVSAKLKFGWGGGWDIWSEWGGFHPFQWTLEVYLSDSDFHPPTWSIGLDNLLEEIVVSYFKGPPTEYVYEVEITGANLATLKAKLETPNNYLVFAFVLHQEREIPDGNGWPPYGPPYGGFVTEPNGQPLPQAIGLMGPIYKWGAIAGAILELNV